MPSTTFVNNQTVIYADWLNDVNSITYNILGNGTTIPATKTAAMTNLGALNKDNNLSDLSSVVSARSNLGLGTAATTAATSYAQSGACTNITSITGLSTPLSTGQGGTGLSTFTANRAFYSSTSSTIVNGTLPVAAGGTGVNTLTSGSLLVGNGTGAVTGVSPSTAGNILKSTGSGWLSSTLETIVSKAYNWNGVSTNTFLDVTIPAGATTIEVMFVSISLNATDNILIQFLDGASPVNAGYVTASSQITTVVASSNYTTGFGIRGNSITSQYSGIVTLKRLNSTTWVGSGTWAADSAVTGTVAGVSLSTPSSPSGIRLTTTSSGGTTIIDAGTLYVAYSPTS
jgi:hypothetical protein